MVTAIPGTRQESRGIVFYTKSTVTFVLLLCNSQPIGISGFKGSTFIYFSTKADGVKISILDWSAFLKSFSLIVISTWQRFSSALLY